eukprot:c10114_g1_i1.p1 GENE.c10114_g1_i1~~c10114_g1_i1.p1  ORF type:complete len:410 (-),score=63.11 c10114_g1_i1:39-1268(-)
MSVLAFISRNVYPLAIVSRILMFAYGEWQDAYFQVKYTDADYAVFSDAGYFVSQGYSPYKRLTYRYTPLLAYLMLPNQWLHPSFGKFLFVICDLLVGKLIHLILLGRNLSNKKSDASGEKGYRTDTKTLINYCVSVWLLNPLVINVSTRGNAEAFVVLLVLLSLYYVLKNQIFVGALWYGLCVHVKIYPIIFALTFCLFIGKFHQKRWSLSSLINSLLCRDVLVFGIVSGVFYILLGAIFYYIYGFEYLYESTLYHFVRSDHRHNFSPYFYSLYLQIVQPSKLFSLAVFIPQLILTLVLSFKFSRYISFCVFLQTFVFVVFNKVCTVQYFIWYLCFLPLMIPDLKCTKTDVLLLTVPWTLSLVAWLYTAYLLEFQGENTFVLIWISGLLFFAANCYVIVRLISFFNPID